MGILGPAALEPAQDLQNQNPMEHGNQPQDVLVC